MATKNLMIDYENADDRLRKWPQVRAADMITLTECS
jgi:hypothetical protein